MSLTLATAINFPGGRAVLATGVDDDDTSWIMEAGGGAALALGGAAGRVLRVYEAPLSGLPEDVTAVEYLLCTAISTDTLTVTRAQQGSVAQAWSAGAIVESVLTTADLDELKTEINLKTTGPGSATNNALPRFSGTNGKVVKNSGVIVDDSNNVTGVAGLTGATLNITTIQSNSSTFDIKGLGTTRIGIDSNNDSVGASFTVRANDTTDVLTVSETGNTTIAGTLAVTGAASAPTAAAGTNTTQLATTAFVQQACDYGTYQTLLSVSGSHTAGQVAGTYAMGHGSPLAVSGTGTLYPIGIIAINSADFPTVNGLSAKLRIRGQVNVNDTAPTGNFTFGLYPITRPGTSGAAGLCIYTLGTVVSGSNGATVTTPAADSASNLVGSDFALPSNGLYVIGVVTTATVAASSHVHLNAQLQVHYA